MRKAAGHIDEFQRRSTDPSDMLVASVRLADSHEISRALSDLLNLLRHTQSLVHGAFGAQMQRYLTTEEAAAYIKVSPSWLNRAKTRHEGPAWISLRDIPGSPVRYDVQDLDTWMRSRRSPAVPGLGSAIAETSANYKRSPVRKIESYKRLRRYDAEQGPHALTE